MKIAYIIYGLCVGGVEVLMLDSLSRFIKRGDAEVVVINLSGQGDLAASYSAAGIPVINLAPDDKRALRTHRLDTVLKLRRLLRQIKPDIIHCQLKDANYFGRLAAWGLGLPVVVHIHSTHSDTDLSAKYRFIHRRLSPLTSLYISVSRMVYDYTQQEQNVADRPSIVIYNGYNPQKMDMPARDLQQDYGFNGPVIIQVGRMVQEKNFNKTIAAMPVILKAQPLARLLLVGDGPQRQALQEQSRGLGDKVVFTGLRNDVPALLKACHLFVMPSQFEGFPISHLEAMACGLPGVISSNVPSQEIAEDSVLVCQSTAESLAENVLRVLGDEQLRAHMAAQAKMVANKFTIDSYCDSMLAVYNNLLQKKPFNKLIY